MNVEASRTDHPHGLVNATPDSLTLLRGDWVLTHLPPSGLGLHAED